MVGLFSNRLKGSGSKNIFFSGDSFPKKLEGESFIAQEFIEGIEYGAQAVIENGKVCFIGISRKELVHRCVPFAHCVIEDCSELESKLNPAIEKICEDLGFKTGTVNLDIRDNGTDLYIIDFSFRLSGNLLIETINNKYNIDLFEYHIQQLLAQPRELIPNPSSKIFKSYILGLGHNVSIDDVRPQILQLLTLSDVNVIELFWDEVEAEKVFASSRDRIGHLMVAFENNVEMIKFTRELKQILGVR